jgi:segregation and condensation protein A
VHRGRLVHEHRCALAHGPEQLGQRLCQVALEVPVAVVAGGHLSGGAPRGHRHQREQVREAGLLLRVVAHLPVGVGDGFFHLARDLGRIVQDVDRPQGRVDALGHLALGVLEVHDARPDRGDRGLGDDEQLAVAAVEALRELAGELEVLALVVAHGHPVRLVEKDVGSHEHWVGEEANPHRLLAVPLGLELGHAAQLAHGRGALEQPGEARVLGDVALDEDRGDIGVQADREQVHRCSEALLAQVRGVDLLGQRVQVDHAVQRVVAPLVRNPLAERPDVVAEVKVAGGLDAREDARHGARSYAGRAKAPRPSTDAAEPVGNVKWVSVTLDTSAHAQSGAAPHVVTPVFEGPIDLLVHLVNSHEVDVVDVPLAPIVEGFVEVLRDHPETVPLEARSQFLLMAAILVEIKSQRLLPGPDVVEDEEELGGWEARDLLIARLLECRAYSAAADAFVVLSERAARSVAREAGLDDGFVVHAPDLLEGVSPLRLAQAYLRATAERPQPRVDLSHVTVDTVTVSETVQALAVSLPGRQKVSFRQLTAHLVNRIEVIVHFLAVLELCKLGKVVVAQAERFGDLEIEWVGEDHPLVEALVGAEEYDG